MHIISSKLNSAFNTIGKATADKIIAKLVGKARGGTPLFGLYGDVPLDRVWFFGLAVLNRVYNLTCLCPKQVKNLS